jgi:hypothetical protein
MMKFPIYRKMEFMFQTTNQYGITQATLNKNINKCSSGSQSDRLKDGRFETSFCIRQAIPFS